MKPGNRARREGKAQLRKRQRRVGVMADSEGRKTHGSIPKPRDREPWGTRREKKPTASSNQPTRLDQVYCLGGVDDDDW